MLKITPPFCPVLSMMEVFWKIVVCLWRITDEKRLLDRKDNQRLPSYFFRIT